MARPLRLEFPGALYHLTARGNARGAIYLDDADRRAFLDGLDDVVERRGWVCHAYCLMTNHYHLLVETPQPNLSRGMRQLNGVYTQGFNRRHERVGHVLQGRFKSLLVERESYLLELCRYVVLNPVRAGMTGRPDDYPWSSYRATAGLEARPRWLATSWVLSQFGSLRVARAHYREFVQAGIGSRSPWENVRGQALLGSDTFAAHVVPLLEEHADAREIPTRQRLASRPSLDELLPVPGVSAKGPRDRAIRRAVEHQYTLAEIGRHVGLHYATVGRIARGEMLQCKT